LALHVAPANNCGSYTRAFYAVYTTVNQIDKSSGMSALDLSVGDISPNDFVSVSDIDFSVSDISPEQINKDKLVLLSGLFQEVDNFAVELVVESTETDQYYRIVARSNNQEAECARFKMDVENRIIILVTYFYSELQAQGAAFLRARGLQANVVMAFLGHLAERNDMLVEIGEDQWNGTTLVENEKGAKVVIGSNALQQAAKEIILWSKKYTPPARRPPPSENYARLAKYSDLEFHHFPLNFPFQEEHYTIKAAAVWLMTAMVRIPRYKRMEFLDRIQRLGFYGQFFNGDTLVTKHIDTQFIRMPAIITYSDDIQTTSSITNYQESPNALDESLLNLSGLSLNSSGLSDFTTL